MFAEHYTSKAVVNGRSLPVVRGSTNLRPVSQKLFALLQIVFTHLIPKLLRNTSLYVYTKMGKKSSTAKWLRTLIVIRRLNKLVCVVRWSNRINCTHIHTQKIRDVDRRKFRKLKFFHYSYRLSMMSNVFVFFCAMTTCEKSQATVIHLP